MSPVLNKPTLKKYFLKYLSYYIDEDLQKNFHTVKKVYNKDLGQNSLEKYKQWLRKNGFLEKVIFQNVSRIENILEQNKIIEKQEFFGIMTLKN